MERMLEPLFDAAAAFVGWMEPNQHIFDVEMRWVAFLADHDAWGPDNLSWLGPVRDSSCFDRDGRVVAWSPNGFLTRLMVVPPPVQPLPPARPLRPLSPVRPLRPVRPLTPLSGWSPLSFPQWLAQEATPVALW